MNRGAILVLPKLLSNVMNLHGCGEKANHQSTCCRAQGIIRSRFSNILGYPYAWVVIAMTWGIDSAMSVVNDKFPSQVVTMKLQGRRNARIVPWSSWFCELRLLESVLTIPKALGS